MGNTLQGKKALVGTVIDGDADEEAPSRLRTRNGVAARNHSCPTGDWQDAVQDFLLSVRTTLARKTADFYADRMRVLMRWAQGVANDGQGVALADFKGRHLRQYLEWRAGQVNPKTGAPPSDTTRRLDAIAARRLLAFCAREEYVPVDPLKNYEIPKASHTHPDCPHPEAVTRLLQACQDRWRPAVNPDARFIHAPGRQFFRRRNHAILCGLVSTGCRVGELLTLRLSDYDTTNRTVHFRDTKGDEDRTVPYEPAWGEIVDLWLRVRPAASPSDTLFVTEFGDALDVDRFRQQFYKDRAFAQQVNPGAGLEKMRLHDLRHYAITQVAKKSVLAAQRQAGHKSLSTTQIYAHADMEFVQATHREAAPLGKILVNVKYEKEKKQKLVGKK